jgi:hypothetical protein
MLYFIATPDLRTIKIGKSKNPLERMMVLQREERQRLILIAQYPMPNVKTEFLLISLFSWQPVYGGGYAI